MVFQYFVETASFADFARYVCALREHPLRVYQFSYKKKNIFSTRKILSKSILHFFTVSEKDGRYISYDPLGGKETFSIVNEITRAGNYAPIVELDSLPFPIKLTKTIKDKFKPIKVHELGDLARLTYDPEWPEDYEFTLLAFPKKKKWYIGYITKFDLDDTFFCFNYVEQDDEPPAPFLKYSGHKGGKAEFTNKFQHGYPYLPVVKLKAAHPIFGLK
ncbi:MAG: hypothetical protein DWQ19_07915 [Crenarchaeota archaeon]|nr:MAG: hypothetical protein DWQ13_09520 [Thermoproteota archaeon]RDJ36498.1 MAG: hypothetical protein DWQ19_07915 [Thermoproteota archaeon]